MKSLILNGSGILFNGKSGIREVLISLGNEAKMIKQKDEYDKNKEKGPWGLDVLAYLFKGFSKFEIEEKCREFFEENLDKDAILLIDKLKDNGFLVVSYGSDLINVNNILKEKLGLYDVCGNELEFENDTATGKLLNKVDRYDRVDKIKRFIKKNNLSKEDVFIVGDSITSLPSAELGRLIAFRSNNKELNNKAEFRVNNITQLLNTV